MLIANAPDALAALWTGFALQASLIIALGAQNAFVLRQGLLRARLRGAALVLGLRDVLDESANVVM